jgi:soluble lytic murein transglycosylase-like protein
MGGPSDSVQAGLAANHAANQQASRNAAMGYSAGGLPYTQTGLGPNIGAQGFNAAGANPFGQYANPQYGSAAYYLNQITQNTYKTATNTATMAGVTAGGVGGGGGPPPGGGGGGGGAFGWGPGGGGQSPVNFTWGGFGGGNSNFSFYNFNMPPPPPPPAARPGGGGGFGGRNIGGVLGGMVGFGATGNALGGLVGMTGPAGMATALAAEVAKEIIFAPQTLGDLEMATLGRAQPYNQIMLGAAAAGRAGGFSGRGLANAIGAGRLTPPDWMADLGLGPAEALELLQNFPIAQRGRNQATGLISALGSLQFQPGLSGLPQGQIEAFAGQAARQGVIRGDEEGVRRLSAFLGEPMTKAVQMGLDRSSILRSMDTSLTLAARSGGSFGGFGNVGNFMTMFRDMPGGRTGEAALAASQGVSGALTSTTNLQNPARVVAMSSWVNKLRTEDDLKSLFNSVNGPTGWAEYMQDPGNRALADQYLRLRAQGQTPFAIRALTDLMNAPGGENVALQMFSNNPVAQQFNNPDINTQMRATLGGQTIRQTLSREGNLAQANLVRQGERRNIDPSVLLGIGQVESGFRNNLTSSAGAQGFMQLMPGTAAHEGITGQDVWDPIKNTTAGAAYFQELLQQFGGDYRMALEAYNWGPGIGKGGVDHAKAIRAGQVPKEVAAYATNVLNRADEFRRSQIATAPSATTNNELYGAAYEENMPRDKLRGQAYARTGGIYGSSFSSAEMNVIVPKVNDGLTTVIKAARDFADAIAGASKAMTDFGQPPAVNQVY